MPNKMTDNEIIKALENQANERRCIHEQYEQACGMWCKYHHKWCADMSGRDDKHNCAEYIPIYPIKMAKSILDLINRQKAENSNLTSHLTSLQNDLTSAKAEIEGLQKENHWFADIGKMYSEVRAEAVKEFAERLKAIIIKCPKNFISITAKDIDNLLKEMGVEL